MKLRFRSLSHPCLLTDCFDIKTKTFSLTKMSFHNFSQSLKPIMNRQNRNNECCEYLVSTRLNYTNKMIRNRRQE